MVTNWSYFPELNEELRHIFEENTFEWVAVLIVYKVVCEVSVFIEMFHGSGNYLLTCFHVFGISSDRIEFTDGPEVNTIVISPFIRTNIISFAAWETWLSFEAICYKSVWANKVTSVLLHHPVRNLHRLLEIFLLSRGLVHLSWPYNPERIRNGTFITSIGVPEDASVFEIIKVLVDFGV